MFTRPMKTRVLSGLGVTFAVTLLATVQTAAQEWTSVERLDAYFAEALRDWEVPGMAIGIIKDGEVVLARGYGVREVGGGDAVDEHTLFAIASNTKAFNAAAIAMLVDEGRLQWTDRARDYLPYLELYNPYVTANIEVRDLLSHRSGYGTFSGDLLWYGTSYTAEEVLRRVRYLPPALGFREGYEYSNLMFLAAGEIVTAITGQPWADFVRARIIDPLGMSETVLSTNDLAGRDNVATPHGVRDGRVRTFDWYNWDNMAAAGGVISNVTDMLRWLQLQLNRGEINGVRFFSEDASRTMWTPHISMSVSASSRERYPTTHFRGYGLGWSLNDYQGRLIASHGGGYDGMFSRVTLVPEDNLGIVILTNGMTGIQTALSYRILDAFLGGEERDWSAESLENARAGERRQQERHQRWVDQRVAGTNPSLDLEAYTGTYGGPMYGDATVSRENGHLVVSFLPNPDLTGDLEHWHYDTFVVRWRHDFPWFDEGTVNFVLDADGQVEQMKIDVPNNDFWFTELEFMKRD